MYLYLKIGKNLKNLILEVFLLLAQILNTIIKEIYQLEEMNNMLKKINKILAFLIIYNK